MRIHPLLMGSLFDCGWSSLWRLQNRVPIKFVSHVKASSALARSSIHANAGRCAASRHAHATETCCICLDPPALCPCAGKWGRGCKSRRVHAWRGRLRQSWGADRACDQSSGEVTWFQGLLRGILENGVLVSSSPLLLTWRAQRAQRLATGVCSTRCTLYPMHNLLLALP